MNLTLCHVCVHLLVIFDEFDVLFLMNLMLCRAVFDVLFDEFEGLFLMFCLVNLKFLTLCLMFWALCHVCVHLLVMSNGCFIFDEFAVLFLMNLMFYV